MQDQQCQRTSQQHEMELPGIGSMQYEINCLKRRLDNQDQRIIDLCRLIEVYHERQISEELQRLQAEWQSTERAPWVEASVEAAEGTWTALSSDPSDQDPLKADPKRSLADQFCLYS